MALTHLTIQQAVADAVRVRIIAGELEAGTRIDQDALAAEFSVSRMPVREALRQLGAEGFVTIVPHRGAIVTALSPGEVEEIYEIRAALEGVAARHASQELTDRAAGRPAQGAGGDAQAGGGHRPLGGSSTPSSTTRSTRRRAGPGCWS